LLTQGGGLLKQSFDIAYAFIRRHQRELFSNRDLTDLDIRVQPNAVIGGLGATNMATGMAVALVSAVAGVAVREQLVVLGGLTLQGVPVGLNGFADILQVVADAGARRVLVPVENRREVSMMPAEILDKVDLIFYGDPKTAINKALQE
jgi:ATP-dependent Lon protease